MVAAEEPQRMCFLEELFMALLGYPGELTRH